MYDINETLCNFLFCSFYTMLEVLLFFVPSICVSSPILNIYKYNKSTELKFSHSKTHHKSAKGLPLKTSCISVLLLVMWILNICLDPDVLPSICVLEEHFERYREIQMIAVTIKPTLSCCCSIQA